MGSLDSVLTRWYSKKGLAQFTSDDTVAGSGPVAVRLRYVGTGTVTSVTVTTGTDIVLITSDGGTDTYAFATYTTLGTLVDAINKDGIFQARVLDSIRSQASVSILVDGAITAGTFEGLTVWDALVDTSAALFIANRITWDRGFGLKPHKATHRVSLQEILYLADAGTAKFVYVYEVTPVGTATLRWKKTAVDNTITTLTFAGGQGRITADDGNDLVVVVDATTSLANGCYLQTTSELE